MKTQYVGVIFTNDIQPGANAKTYYFRDNTGAAVGDELVVRLSTGRLAVVEVVTVSDVAPSEKVTFGHQLGQTLCKVDKSAEEKHEQYRKNKYDALKIFKDIATECASKLSEHDVARTLLCSLPATESSSLWEKFFKAERLQEEVESYEKEYGICE